MICFKGSLWAFTWGDR